MLERPAPGLAYVQALPHNLLQQAAMHRGSLHCEGSLLRWQRKCLSSVLIPISAYWPYCSKPPCMAYLGEPEAASPESACQQAQHEHSLLVVLLAAAEEQLLQQGDVLQQKAAASVMRNATRVTPWQENFPIKSAAACMTSWQGRMLHPTAQERCCSLSHSPARRIL